MMVAVASGARCLHVPAVRRLHVFAAAAAIMPPVVVPRGAFFAGHLRWEEDVRGEKISQFALGNNFQLRIISEQRKKKNER